MLSIRRVLLAATFFIGATPFLAAQFPVPIVHPDDEADGPRVREIVSKYCRLDYEGDRLDPQVWAKFEPLVWWKAAPDYSKVNVVARFTVDAEPTSKNGKYTVTVHYRLLGTYDLATGYVREPDGSTQDVDFTVTSENTEWRIADAENTLPHPSRAAMLKWLNTKLNTTTDEAAKAHYQDALTKLQAQSASPFAR